jgi:hypothetical protein
MPLIILLEAFFIPNSVNYFAKMMKIQKNHSFLYFKSIPNSIKNKLL